MANQQRYPLSWPDGWKRTAHRSTAKFAKKVTQYGSVNATDGSRRSWQENAKLTVGDALRRLTDELRRLRADKVTISANLRLNLDGSITANQAKVLTDPGIAVYFTLNKKERVLACDAWNNAADNMAAIAGHIAALRAQERYGVGTLDQAFTGYAALPAKGDTWKTTLGFAPDQYPDEPEIRAMHRLLAKEAHPDRKGGSHDAMASLNAALTEGLAAIGVK